MPAIATRQQKRSPVKSVLIVIAISSLLNSQRFFGGLGIPALFIQISIDPNAFLASCHNFSTSEYLLTSQGMPTICSGLNCDDSSLIALVTEISDRPLMTTLHPLFKNSLARPKPMPRVLPVMTTCFIFSLPYMNVTIVGFLKGRAIAGHALSEFLCGINPCLKLMCKILPVFLQHIIMTTWLNDLVVPCLEFFR